MACHQGFFTRIEHSLLFILFLEYINREGKISHDVNNHFFWKTFIVAKGRV